MSVEQSRRPRVRAAPEDAQRAAASIHHFGADLYDVLAAGSPPNLVFSPASVALALAMSRAGASGVTAAQLDSVLHADMAVPLHRAMNALSTELDDRNADTILSIVNSLWAQSGYPFDPPFLDVLATEYGSALCTVDYASDPERARRLINEWVENETRGRIPSLLPQGSVDAISRLTLVNAIYMKARWLSTFSEYATRPADFTRRDGSVVTAAMMHLTRHLRHARGDGWQAIELPYAGDQLAMVVVLPAAGLPIGAALPALQRFSATAEPTRVHVSLPKFDIETASDLASALAGLGMPSAFEPTGGGFTAIADVPGEPLFIGAVVHQANITVDENGTEAAAATAVTLAAGSAPVVEPPIEFNADRPFLFAVRDLPTGAILFLGHVGDPTRSHP